MDFETAATLKPRPLIDPFARAITYLRVSVTDRCDFRCVYCMAENMVFLPKQDLLSLEELDRLCSAFVAKGVRKLRLTGGEPLVRRGIMTLFASLSRHLAAGDLPLRDDHRAGDPGAGGIGGGARGGVPGRGADHRPGALADGG